VSNAAHPVLRFVKIPTRLLHCGRSMPHSQTSTISPLGDAVAALAPHAPIASYYDGEAERRGFVSRAFDAGAHDYERIERWMAFGTGAWYRRRALVRAGLQPGMHVLDVAAGTGLVTREAAGVVGPGGSVVGLDPSDGMLREAAARAAAPASARADAPPPAPVSFVRGVAERLPFEAGRFDFLSMGYALRHVADLPTVFREYRRVLKPGATACVLEITRPPSRVAMTLMRWYMRGVVPRLSRLTRRRGTRAAADSQTLWQYYWDTIEACVPPQGVLGAMSAAGFNDVKRHVELGIFSEYTGTA
jgi:demethylmenaquinone methyltransferase/2-methoxy-6-polyprenyl-1,4-benzoquinol methylase